MKKLSLLLASLALVGAGCAGSSSTDVQTDGDIKVLPPTVEGDVNADVNVNVGDDVNAGAEVGGGVEVEAPLKAFVSILAGGEYSPATIRVKKGGKVTWTNTGVAKVWVASDPHPTHQGLVGFDSKATLAPTETWSFTFDKAGTFGFHNHLNPAVKGTVVVTEE